MDKQPLKGLLKKIISDLKKEEEKGLDVLRAWQDTVGKKASQHTRPAFLRSKKLVVNVSDSSWLYKLTLEKNKLIQKFNNNLKGRKKIKELQFRIGEVYGEEKSQEER